jgi:hypothetical protein
MRHLMIAVVAVAVLSVVGVASAQVIVAQNVPVTEKRTGQPFKINWNTAYKLASHIFAAEWIKTCIPEWHKSYPSPARITTCYGRPVRGDSLTPVNDTLCQRPCWVFWKEQGLTGVAIEQGCEGNTIVSTFTVLRQPETVVCEREVVHETLRTRTEYVQNPGTVETVFLTTSGYRLPAGITQVSTTNLTVPNGRTFYGPEENQIYVSFRRQQEVVCKTQPEPDDGTCGPGTPPTPPPPTATDPPDTTPPIGDGGGWNGPHQPPDQPIPPGVDDQPHEPPPPAAE